MGSFGHGTTLIRLLFAIDYGIYGGSWLFAAASPASARSRSSLSSSDHSAAEAITLAELPAKRCSTEGLNLPWLPVSVAECLSTTFALIVLPVTRIRLRFSFLDPSIVNDRKTLELRYISEPRGYCTLASPLSLDPAYGFCVDCSSQPCPLAAQGILGSRDWAAELPSDGGCVYIDFLPPGEEKVMVRWERHWDYTVLARLLAGFVLVWGWSFLSESVSFHASLGAVLSVLVVLLAVLFWLQRVARGALGGFFPGGSLGVLGLLFALIPSIRMGLLAYLLPESPDFRSGLLALLQFCDPVYGFPVGAASVFSALALAFWTINFGAKLSMGCFAGAPEPEGEVPFCIARDGRRIDVLPPVPFSQRMLGWLLWTAGLALLLSSANLDSASVSVAVLALLKDRIIHFLFLRSIAYGSRSPSEFRRLVCSSQFELQGKSHTERALADLSAYLNSASGELGGFRVVRQDSELHLRRFSSGAPHYHEQDQLVLADVSWGRAGYSLLVASGFMAVAVCASLALQ